MVAWTGPVNGGPLQYNMIVTTGANVQIYLLIG